MLHDIIDQIFLDHRRHDNAPSPPHTPPTSTAMSADAQQPATCPVDHKSREAWLDKAKATSESSTTTGLPPSHPPVDTRTQNAESCPVDHGAREVWMQQARAASEAPANVPSPSPQPSSSWSSYLPRVPFFSSTTATSQTTAPGPPKHLGVDREVSTIPRTSSLGPGIPPRGGGGDHAPPANNEQETGATGPRGTGSTRRSACSSRR